MTAVQVLSDYAIARQQPVRNTAAVSDFYEFAHTLVRNRFDLALALRREEGKRSPNGRVIECLRSAVSAGSLSGWGSPLAYQQLASAFATTIVSQSILDAMLTNGSIIRVPLNQRISISTAVFAASEVGETMLKPMTAASFSAPSIPVRKVAGVVAVTDEVAKLETPATTQLFDAQLRQAAIAAMNAAVIPTLYKRRRFALWLKWHNCRRHTR
jgi:HK97 family phage major capsid protein